MPEPRKPPITSGKVTARYNPSRPFLTDPPKKKGAALTEQQMQWILENAIGVKGLETLLDKLDRLGLITSDEQYAQLSLKYLDTARANEQRREVKRNRILGYAGLSGEVKAYLNAFTSPGDLANRIEQLSVLGVDYADRNMKADLYDTMIADYDNDILKQEQKWSGELQNWANATNKANSANAMKFFGNRAAQAQEQNAAILGAFGSPQRQLNYGTRPTPLSQGELQQGVAGIGGYGAGTRLNQFIQGESARSLNDIAGARESWWNRVQNTPGVADVSRRTMLEEDRDRFKQLMGSLPNGETTLDQSGYWGEGGPAGMAKSLYENALMELGRLQPEDYAVPEAPTYEQDPAKAEIERLKRENWWARYNRQPGTGASSRFAPSVRFR